MKEGKIKTDWASLSLAQDGNAIVCIKRKDMPCCIRFDSLKQLKQAVDTKKISVKRWAVAVPRSSCILKQLTLPASDLAEAAKMIEFELPSLVPLPPDKIVYGCTLLSKQDNMLNVLVCVLKLSMLNRHLEQYRAAKIEPRRITLNSLAIQSWFNTTNGSISKPEISIFVNKHQCIILTGINGNFNKVKELTLTGTDVTLSSHEITHEILRQQEQLHPSLRKQTVVSLAGTKQYVLEIKNLLCGVSGDCLFGKVAVVPNPRITYYEDGKSEYDSADFSYDAVIAAGLLESATNSKLQYSNLLPQQYLRKYQQKTLLFDSVITGSLSVLLILMLWLCLAAMNWRIEKLSRQIELKIVPIEHIAGSVDSKRQRVKAIQKQLSNRGQITQIAEELYKYTPPGISISELKFTSRHSGANIEIKGHADLLSNAFEYADAMSKADLLNTIQIINAQQIPRLGGSVVEFKSNCSILIGLGDVSTEKIKLRMFFIWPDISILINKRL